MIANLRARAIAAKMIFQHWRAQRHIDLAALWSKRLAATKARFRIKQPFA